MSFPPLRSFHLSRKRLLILGLGALVPFAACTTEDPIPGIGAPAPVNSSSGGATAPGGASSATGGSFNFGEGGAGGETIAPDDVCGEPPVSTQAFTKKRLLESAGACEAHHICRFSSAVTELVARVNDYSDDPSDENLGQAQQAWGNAMVAWATSVPAQYGPVASVAADIYHGRGIGSFIHSWPGLNRCEIEKQVATRFYEEEGFQRVLPAARGLPALEYLLFYGGSDTVCASNASATQIWAELSPAELSKAKRDYAKAVAGDLNTKAEELVKVWATDGEDFGATLASGEGYGSEQEALNVVAWSLLYPYTAVRDLKVAPLAGIGTALENSETPYAQIDLFSIRANLEAFRALFQGCGEDGEGLGFDDWLVAVGAGDLSADILAALTQVEARAAELPALHEASPEQMAAFYADLKVLSDLLKEEFFGSGSVLNLKLPASAASDTD